MGNSQEPSDLPVLEMCEAEVASVHTPGTTVIERVNWTVRAGEFWVVVGGPASGKSDLLTTAAGLIRPRSGSVRLFGKELPWFREEERLRIQLRAGLVFGYGGRLFNDLTVAENLALAWCYHQNCSPKASAARVLAVLSAMELESVADRLPMSTSRNIRQRVALARALVLSPELLLLDNPLVGIDLRETRWWTDFLEKLRAGHPLVEGRAMTIVAGTDDLRPWGECASRFALLEEQRFLLVGGRDELRRTTHQGLRSLMPAGWVEE